VAKYGEFDRNICCSCYMYNAPIILNTWFLTCMECVTLQTPHTLYRTSMLSVRKPNISHPEDIPNRSEVYDSSVDCTVERSTVMRSISRQFYWNTTKQWSTKRTAKYNEQYTISLRYSKVWVYVSFVDGETATAEHCLPEVDSITNVSNVSLGLYKDPYYIPLYKTRL
jgi:hypothetical protein